jgi:predicted secreted protein
MATSARIGHGSLFKIGNGASPEVFTTVAEVTGITPPAMSRDSIDATHSESPDGWREFIGGLKDGGEVELTLNWVPGSATTILLMSEIAAAAGNKQITFPNGEIFSFAALCTNIGPEAPVDGKMEATVSYKVTGKPTLA